MVGTADVSVGGMAGGGLQKKVFQVCDRPRPLLAMYLATVDCAIWKPSLSSSPWMRGAPQSRFSLFIRPNRCPPKAEVVSSNLAGSANRVQNREHFERWDSRQRPTLQARPCR